MGSLQVDIHKKEREYEHFALSDENVVRLLIQYRSKYDILRNANSNIDIGRAGDNFDFNQEIITIYASLDETIKQCGFKEKQTILIELLFDGNSIADVINHYDFAKKTAYRMFDKIIDRIVEQNYINWKNSLYKQGFIERDNL